MSEDSGRAELQLKELKGIVAGLGPIERYAFPRERCHWGRDSGEVLDEPPIGVRKAQECLDITEVFGACPVFDCGNFVGFHLDSFCGYDQAKVLRFRRVDFAFVYVGLQASCYESLRYRLYVLFVCLCS